jgi:hypothetical protein
LYRLTQSTKNSLFIHPYILTDIENDKDQSRKTLRKTLLSKYNPLKHPPNFDNVNKALGVIPNQGSNDWVDHHLLGALLGDAVDYLVTEDINVHKKAERIGLSNRVLYLKDAVDFLNNLFGQTPEPPPLVENVYVYQIDDNEYIFQTLKEDYKDFNLWIKKCKTEHRKAFVVRTDGVIAGICILKEENMIPITPYTRARVLKLCTFKVDAKYEGNKYGELLFKAVFDYIDHLKFEYTYFTVYPKHGKLINFAIDFGFELIKGGGGEDFMIKRFNYQESDIEKLQSLDFHIKFGPLVTHFRGNNSFIVPIKPEYHKILFPEPQDQALLWPGERPCGNSIKKAYLSHSRINQIKKGDNIFFYRSEDAQGLTVLGIVEDICKTIEPLFLIKFVGQRTVYSLTDLESFCSKEVLAIKFRVVKIFNFPILLESLIDNNVLKAPPQSITKIGENIEWLQKAIEM